HRLRSGDIDVGFARNVGDVLGRIHAATADRADVAEQFRTDENFFAIRLEPYLVAAARVHPDRAPALHALAEVTANERRALVHGDVSPKNILVGKAPVFLDAECAWYGDPAFDLAFCLNHLLLKSIWLPAYRGRLLDAFGALCDGYFRQARFESRASLERRTACLLPGLMLARVDGKSPVEYLDREELRGPVRRFARDELLHPTSDLVALRRHWAERLAA
ncbi:MAG: phosphotransferase, partial [Gammaproteobacteria bacterium]|nr:phosphotransferase [Gammaproteobacteria bacterium]